MSGFRWYPGAREALGVRFAEAVTATANDIVADVDARGVVPHADYATRRGHFEGALEHSVSVRPAKTPKSGARIEWDFAGAARVYFHPNWQFRTSVNANARGRWMEDYMRRGERSGFVLQRYLLRVGEVLR